MLTPEPPDYLNLPDYELCILVREQVDSDALRELARRHQGMAVKFATKYQTACEQKGVPLDLAGDSLTILWEAAKTYQPDRGCKFSSFLARKAQYFCLQLLRRSANRPVDQEGGNNLDILARLPASESVYGEIAAKENSEALRRLCAAYPDAKGRKVVKMRYFGSEFKTLAEVAAKLKLTGSRVQQIHAEFCQWARKKLSEQ